MLRRLIVAPLLLAVSSCSWSPATDRLFVGGNVHLPHGVRRAAVAVAEGRIVAVVTPAEVPAWRRRTREVVDLAGAHVYPGFTESHGHFIGYGAALEQVDLVGTTSYDEVIERVRRAAAELPPNSWVRGRGWDQNDWSDKAFPDHRRLSAAVADHPVALWRVDGHAVLTNAKGLEAAGISATTLDPPGGRILRGARGEPTGVLVDTAADLIARVIPPPSAADVERQAVLSGRKLTSFGITEIHDAGTARLTLAVLRQLAAERRLPVRVYIMLAGDDDELLDGEMAAGPRLEANGWLAVRAVKLFADGALGSRGALLSEPYSDDPGSRGLEVTSPARMADVVRRAAAAGFQPCTHAIGDAAVTRVLDLYEHDMGGRSRELRARVEHAQIVRPEDVPRFAALGVIASVQPTQCTSDMPWAPARLGPQRIAWAYRWRSLLDAGARLAFGSDVPVESPDPRLGLWAAITRQTPAGQPPGGWNREEAVTAAEAVDGYTTWAAYAAFEEDWRGTIAPGYAADLTVLDRDVTVAPPTQALDAKVLRTVVAGRDAYVAGDQEP